MNNDTNIKRCNIDKKSMFYYKDVIAVISSCIIKMSPYIDSKRLECINNIILSVSDKFMQSDVYPKNSYSSNHYLYMTKEEFKQWLNDSLFNIDEFRNLNLSYNEQESGITVDDENRLKYNFTSMYDIEFKDSWKDDFIDLDACIRNIYLSVIKSIDESDCFTCIHNNCKESSECSNCINNPKFKNNYQYENQPFSNAISRWCTHSCAEGIAVCCYDCMDNKICKNRCCGSYFTDSNINCSALVQRYTLERQ